MVVWVALGQTPSIQACQGQLFTQLTGTELPLELTTDEKLIKIRDAFAGKDVLLVLDDVWETEHISSFALVDEGTRSKILLSSRVRSTLELRGCEVVDIGLPTEADAIEMVMTAAGKVVNFSGSIPVEAREVVRLCKLLPLTLGIAGRLVKGLGLQDDWSEVTMMMKEELSVDGVARSAEDSVIATSLRAIKGRDADSARALFTAFRLVPEDVKVPLQALQWVHEASTGGSGGGAGEAPSLLQLRRWTKLLIDRCLVLGPVDQPSVHDIVKDYVDSVEPPEVTRDAHRQLVNIFRARRPGQHGWDLSETDDRLSRYVIKHAGHNISQAWLPMESEWSADTEGIAWLEDYGASAGMPLGGQDIIPLATARFLGTEKVSLLAEQAETKTGGCWSAALLWSATALETRNSFGIAASHPLLKRCAAVLERVQPEAAATALQAKDAKERLELSTLMLILLAWDTADIAVYQSRLEPLKSSDAAKANTDMLAFIFLMQHYFPQFFGVQHKGTRTPDELLFGKMTWTHLRFYLETVAQEEIGSRKRARFLALAFGFNHSSCFLDLMLDAHDEPEALWDAAFGPEGSLLKEVSIAYDYDKHHTMLKSQHSFDGAVKPPAISYDSLFHLDYFKISFSVDSLELPVFSAFDKSLPRDLCPLRRHCGCERECRSYTSQPQADDGRANARWADPWV